jgi:hypothetical protein
MYKEFKNFFDKSFSKKEILEIQSYAKKMSDIDVVANFQENQNKITSNFWL